MKLQDRMTEQDYLTRVTDYCDRLHLWWNHNPDSRRSGCPGLPDLLIGNLDAGKWLWVELKAEKGRLSVAQQEVLFSLERGGYTCMVVKPSGWDELATRLRDLAAGGQR